LNGKKKKKTKKKKKKENFESSLHLNVCVLNAQKELMPSPYPDQLWGLPRLLFCEYRCIFPPE
jgi:hypothetical protein